MNILHLQINGNIRTWKQAKVMHDAGHKVFLAFVKKPPHANLPGLDPVIWEDSKRLDRQHPNKWLASHSSGIDVIHSHDNGTTMWAWGTGRPLVHDVHDLHSLAKPGDGEILATERKAIKKAHCVLSVSEHMADIVWKLHGRRSNILYNFPVREQLVEVSSVAKRSQGQLRPSAVYCGRINRRHREFSDFFRDLVKNDVLIKVHSWNARGNEPIFSIPGVTNGGLIHPMTVCEQMASHDAGLIPYWWQEMTEHLNTSMAHKFWDLMAARVPVFTYPLLSYRRWFEENPTTGGTFTSAAEAARMIHAARDGTAYVVNQRHVHVMEEQVFMMENVYGAAMSALETSREDGGGSAKES
jgi:hypothetical protein